MSNARPNVRTLCVKFGLFALLVFLPRCSLGEPSKPLHFYTLDPVTDGGSNHGNSNKNDRNPPESSGAVTISVEEFQGSGIYRETPILWRDQQHLQRFQFNRWANPPAAMLQDVVVELLRRESGSGVSWIYSAPSDRPESPFVVQGKLRHLYLRRKGNSWEAILGLDLLLVDNRSGNQEEMRPSPSREVLGRWQLSAVGSTSAPADETGTPAAMNELLSSLNADISENGGRIARRILKRVNEKTSASAPEEDSSTDDDK